MKCPKCKGEMEKGMIPDKGRNIASPSKWVKNIIGGGMFGLTYGNYQIESYRCKSCGYLENYAK